MIWPFYYFSVFGCARPFNLSVVGWSYCSDWLDSSNAGRIWPLKNRKVVACIWPFCFLASASNKILHFYIYIGTIHWQIYGFDVNNNLLFMKLTNISKKTTCMKGKTYNCSLDTNENAICGKNKLLYWLTLGQLICFLILFNFYYIFLF